MVTQVIFDLNKQRALTQVIEHTSRREFLGHLKSIFKNVWDKKSSQCRMH